MFLGFSSISWSVNHVAHVVSERSRIKENDDDIKHQLKIGIFPPTHNFNIFNFTRFNHYNTKANCMIILGAQFRRVFPVMAVNKA